MGERVRIDRVGGWHTVGLDGVEVFRSASSDRRDAFRDGLRLGLESAGSDVVADTARALDETLDDGTAPFRVGDRVRDDDGDVGTVVDVHDGLMDVRYDSIGIGLLTGLGKPGGLKFKLLSRPGPPGPPRPFKVGDRVRDCDGDVGTVVSCRGTEMDVRYDDPPLGLMCGLATDGGLGFEPAPGADPPGTSHAFKVGDRVVHCGDRATVTAVFPGEISVEFDDDDIGLVDGVDPEGCRPLPPGSPVTPHPARPATADGEIPEGWREDCMGSLYTPCGCSVVYVRERDWWYAGGPDVLGGGPKHFYRRSEAIDRLRELLDEGGEA